MSQFIHTLLFLSATTTLFILPLLLLRNWFYKKYHPFLFYSICLILALHLLLPYQINISQIGLKPINIAVPTNITIGQEKNTAPLVLTEPEPETARLQQSFQVAQTIPSSGSRHLSAISLCPFLFCVWLAGFLSYLLQILLAYRYFCRQLQQNLSPLAPSLLPLLHKLQWEMGVYKEITILQTSLPLGPLLYGFWRPKIVLPNQPLSITEYEMILRHELMHAKHHDLLAKAMMQIANAVHWFNPFVYFLTKECNNACEHYCDHSVLQGQDKSYIKAYGDTILTVMQQNKKKTYAFTTQLSGNQKTIKKRFTHMLDKAPKKRGILCFVLILCLTLGITACVTVKPDHPQQALEPENTISASYEETIKAILNRNYLSMAKLSTPYVGDPVAVGKVLSATPLNPYRIKGLQMQTAQRPYRIILDFSMPLSLQQDEIINALDIATVLDCFVLIANVDQVELNHAFFDEKGQETKEKRTTLFNRTTINGLLQCNVQNLANDPNRWKNHLEKYLTGNMEQYAVIVSDCELFPQKGTTENRQSQSDSIPLKQGTLVQILTINETETEVALFFTGSHVTQGYVANTNISTKWTDILTYAKEGYIDQSPLYIKNGNKISPSFTQISGQYRILEEESDMVYAELSNGMRGWLKKSDLIVPLPN